MESRVVDRLRYELNNEVVRRLLIKYFVDKGYENFDTLVYPPHLQDLPMAVPQLIDKVEVVPHARGIDPVMDTAELGWNIFVLGSQRQYLGETYHRNLHQLALQIRSGQVISEDYTATRQTTPRAIVTFITRVMSASRAGYVNLDPPTVPVSYNGDFGPRAGGQGMQSSFFTRSGYGT